MSHLRKQGARIHSLLVAMMVLVACWTIDGGLVEDVPQRVSTGPSHFSYPPNCSEIAKPKDQVYCVTGELDLGLKWLINIDMFLFDVFDPIKTVLFGINATINKGIPEALEVRTAGCATPVLSDAIKVLNIEQGVTVCTSQGGPGKCNPETKSCVAPFNVSGYLGIYNNRSLWLKWPFTYEAYAWAKPHFDMGINATYTITGGDPDIIQFSLSFIDTIHSVNGSILTWQIINGGSWDTYTTRFGHNYHNWTIANKTIQLQPPE
ncbi:hypothetical protein FOZ62_023872 [Perkinsus olseni]|uniref:Uncharacterized protein n=1 Tax=Perkinsus olseni TaxID=32597 RepID=A0A7J6U079_PEROL|nr:hypothetical protein FOZ62_023872 [Perkinsus olseni]